MDIDLQYIICTNTIITNMASNKTSTVVSNEILLLLKSLEKLIISKDTIEENNMKIKDILISLQAIVFTNELMKSSKISKVIMKLQKVNKNTDINDIINNLSLKFNNISNTNSIKETNINISSRSSSRNVDKVISYNEDTISNNVLDSTTKDNTIKINNKLKTIEVYPDKQPIPSRNKEGFHIIFY